MEETAYEHIVEKYLDVVYRVALTIEPSFSTPERSELYDAVLKLPVKYREVVHLYYYEGYSIQEISKLLHISQTAIQTRLMRARNTLKQQLKEAWK